MTTVVVPFRGTDPKQRLALGDAVRRKLAEAMLADVVAAPRPVGDVLVVAPADSVLPDAVTRVDDPRRGQGAAARAGLCAAGAAGPAGAFPLVHTHPPCARPP